jgi:hypothetical protein
MRNIARISAAGTLLGKSASITVSRAFPEWIGAAPSVVTPRVRDNLVLRLVAGRRQERDKNLIHATGAT